MEFSYWCSAFQLLQAAELQPNRDLGFCIVRACFNNQRPDLAVAYARQADKRTFFPLSISTQHPCMLYICSVPRFACQSTLLRFACYAILLILRLVDSHMVPFFGQFASYCHIDRLRRPSVLAQAWATLMQPGWYQQQGRTLLCFSTLRQAGTWQGCSVSCSVGSLR